MTRSGHIRPIDDAWKEGARVASVPTIRQGDDDSVAAAVIEAPATVSVIMSCPTCDQPVTVAAKLFTRLTKDSDGSSALALKLRAPKAAHSCGQIELGLVEGERTR